jgi:hypothetical protein
MMCVERLRCSAAAGAAKKRQLLCFPVPLPIKGLYVHSPSFLQPSEPSHDRSHSQVWLSYKSVCGASFSWSFSAPFSSSGVYGVAGLQKSSSFCLSPCLRELRYRCRSICRRLRVVILPRSRCVSPSSFLTRLFLSSTSPEPTDHALSRIC